MRTIWKYELTPSSYFTMPAGAMILDVQVQYDKPCMWALVDTDQATYQQRHFVIYGTGHVITHDDMVYIGTFQLDHGSLVFHVFEVFE